MTEYSQNGAKPERGIETLRRSLTQGCSQCQNGAKPERGIETVQIAA